MAAEKLSAPIVLMSGVDDKVLRTVGDLGTDLGLNMRGVLGKPIRLETFRRTLEEHAAPPGIASLRRVAERHRDGQLVLHYQPLVRLASRDLIGFEALVRWNHRRKA